MNNTNKKIKTLEESYDVEAICKMTVRKGQLFFTVKWSGYHENENTKEPMVHLLNCSVFQEFINEEFENNNVEIIKIINEIKQYYIEVDKDTHFNEFIWKAYCIAIATGQLKLDKNLQLFLIRGYKEQEQQEKLNKFTMKIHEKDPCVKLEVENLVDWETPENFKYVTKNIVKKSNREKSSGCQCVSCGTDVNCCYLKEKRTQPFKRNSNGEIIVKGEEKLLIECGEGCECGQDCLFRVSQSKKKNEFKLVKTENRGWTLLTMQDLEKSSFVLEYTGRLMPAEESSDSEYTFEMKCSDKRQWIIDAKRKGNLARFINHSCDPNLKVWIVNYCGNSPLTQKICFFAQKKIKADTELSIDYDFGKLKSKSFGNMTGTACKCGSKKCRRIFFIKEADSEDCASIVGDNSDLEE